VSADARPIVYCSGGLFAPAELRAMQHIADVLADAGYDTFLPQSDGLEAYVMNPVNRPWANLWLARPLKRQIEKAIFTLDIYQLVERCAAVVVNLDGRVPDEGMVVELAVARAAGKPVVAFSGDARSLTDGRLSPPLRLTPQETVGLYKDLPGAIARALSAPAHESLPLSARLQNDVRKGRRVWRWLQRLRGWRPANVLLENG